jgi:hypothetical protein
MARCINLVVPFLVCVTCLALRTADAAPVQGLAHAESLYVSGDLAAATPAFAALKGAPDDTSIVLRRASLALLRNDLHGARAALAPVLAKPAVPRSANVILAESYARELDFARAAPIQRQLGHDANVRQLESFAGSTPYRYEGPDRVTVKFVQTDPLPVIEAKVDGRGPYFFLIDTGGPQFTIDPVLADSLGAPRFGEEQGTFAGGRKSPVGRSRIRSLGLGDATFHDVPVSLLDCSRFSPMAGGRRIMGVLGTLVLMRTRATLDYPGGALILERRGSTASGATPDSSRHVMPMWLAGDHYILARGRLGDGPEALWFVDTGLAGSAVTAPASTLTAAGLTVRTPILGHVGIGGGGGRKPDL